MDRRRLAGGSRVGSNSWAWIAATAPSLAFLAARVQLRLAESKLDELAPVFCGIPTLASVCGARTRPCVSAPQTIQLTDGNGQPFLRSLDSTGGSTTSRPNPLPATPPPSRGRPSLATTAHPPAQPTYAPTSPQHRNLLRVANQLKANWSRTSE